MFLGLKKFHLKPKSLDRYQDVKERGENIEIRWLAKFQNLITIKLEREINLNKKMQEMSEKSWIIRPLLFTLQWKLLQIS